MSGEQPKIMGILPFSCRARVVRPKEFVVKSRIDAHAWMGANLGRRSASSPGAYNVWVPSTGRVHCSSDIYFTERFFPHRPAGNQHVGPDLPAAAAVDASQPPGIPISVRPDAPAPPLDTAWRDSVRAEAVRLVEAAMLQSVSSPPPRHLPTRRPMTTRRTRHRRLPLSPRPRRTCIGNFPVTETPTTKPPMT